MLLRTADIWISGETGLAKWGVLKWVKCHRWPPSGFADFLSEITKRRVKTGLKLERGRGGSAAGRENGIDRQGNIQSIRASHKGEEVSISVILRVDCVLTEPKVVVPVIVLLLSQSRVGVEREAIP